MRTIIVFTRDHELAEIAALGLRVTAGWKVVIATRAELVRETAEAQSAYAILSIALDSTFEILCELRDLNNAGSDRSVPVVVITPEPFLYQQLLSFGVLPICAAFDPLMLSSLITQAVTSIPALPIANIASA